MSMPLIGNHISKRHLRYFRETLFKGTTFLALACVLGALLFLLTAVVIRAYEALVTTEISLSVVFPTPITPETLEKNLERNKLKTLFSSALVQECPFLQTPLQKMEALDLISQGAKEALKRKLQEHFQKHNTPVRRLKLWVLSSDEADRFFKGKSPFFRAHPSSLSKTAQEVLETLMGQKKTRLRFNITFFSANDSMSPELAGICGAFWGSVLVLLVSFVFAFPLGIGTALYIEELNPKSWWVKWMEVKLNNLASVPSALFGLLGFILFDYWLEFPRPSPLMGGLTIGLMTAPLLMVTSRVALQSVPANVRTSAQALGATKAQTMIQHVLPIAFPQIITATLLTLARSLGETAPHLMVGMAAFVGDTPSHLTSPATTLPSQIFLWARSSEPGFLSKASGGILALFFLLLLINICAFSLRRFFKRAE
jgi:phosphate transport system permease protein